MKNLGLLALSLIGTCTVLAQGTVLFSNLTLGPDARMCGPGNTPLEGTAWLAQLYAGPGQFSLEAVGSAVPFRTGAAAGYFDGGAVEIPSVLPGATAWAQVRMWEAAAGATYEMAAASGGRYGTSLTFGVVTGGWGSPPALPASLNGLRGTCSRAVSLTILPARSVVVAGGQTSFTVQSSGIDWLMWLKDGSRIAGGASLTLTNLHLTDGGTYYALGFQEGAMAPVASSGATLVVVPEPRITPPKQEGDTLNISVPAASGGVYILQANDTLDTAGWVELTRVTATNTQAVLVDPTSPSRLQRLYRVRVE